MEPRFDPTRSVRFDLRRGVVSLDEETPRLLVPADLLAELLGTAGPDAARDFGRRLGTELGRRVAGRLGDAGTSASAETVLEHLGGELALLGLGDLRLERWGAALVFHVSSPARGAGRTVIGAVLEGALQRGFGRDARCVRLMEDGDESRWVALAPATAERVEGWLASGIGWGEALGRLATPAARPANDQGVTS